MRGKRTYGGRPGQRVEEQGTWASRTQKHSEAGYGRPVDRGTWAAKTVKRPRQQPAHPQYANYWAPLTRKRHTMPHSAQPQHTNHGAPRTRKRHQQEHRPQRLTESSDPTQHAKGGTGDCPGPQCHTGGHCALLLFVQVGHTDNEALYVHSATDSANTHKLVEALKGGGILCPIALVHVADARGYGRGRHLRMLKRCCRWAFVPWGWGAVCGRSLARVPCTAPSALVPRRTDRGRTPPRTEPRSTHVRPRAQFIDGPVPCPPAFLAFLGEYFWGLRSGTRASTAGQCVPRARPVTSDSRDRRPTPSVHWQTA